MRQASHHAPFQGVVGGCAESQALRVRELLALIGRGVGAYVLMPIMMFPLGGMGAIFLFWIWSGWLDLCGGPASFCDMISLTGLFIPGGIGLSLFTLIYNIRESAHRKTESTSTSVCADQSSSTRNSETAQPAQPSATPNETIKTVFTSPLQPLHPQHKGVIDLAVLKTRAHRRAAQSRSTVSQNRGRSASYKHPVKRHTPQDFICRRCGHTYHRSTKQKFCPECGF